jgi:hypothetical protein
MARSIQITIVAAILINSGCASKGPVVRIETPEPAEDFVVVCKWVKNGLLNIHGGKKLSDEKVFVTESGKDVDCGISIWGGEGGSSVLHPLYTNMQAKKINGVSVVRPKTKLQVLDEQRAKFEAGYWNAYQKPGAEYAQNLVGCGFPHQYFDYYHQVKKIRVEHFRKLYHEPMLDCFNRTFSITKKYDPQIGTQLPSAGEWMTRMWESDMWGEYK